MTKKVMIQTGDYMRRAYLKRQIERIRQEVSAWPTWKKEAANHDDERRKAFMSPGRALPRMRILHNPYRIRGD